MCMIARTATTTKGDAALGARQGLCLDNYRSGSPLSAWAPAPRAVRLYTKEVNDWLYRCFSGPHQMHIWEFWQGLLVTYVNLCKVFNSVNQDALWRILGLCGVPPKLIDLMSELYSGTESAARCGDTFSNLFPVLSGVCQGCVLVSGFAKQVTKFNQ